MIPVSVPKAGRQSEAVSLGFWLSIVIHVVGLPLLLWSGGGVARQEYGDVSGVLAVVVLYTGARLSYELLIGGRRWFVVAFHVFAYVFLGVVPLAEAMAGEFPTFVGGAPVGLFVAAVTALIGILAFDCGLLCAGVVSRVTRQPPALTGSGLGNRTAPQNGPEHAGDAVDAAGWVSNAALILLIVLTCLGLLLLLARAGPEELFTSRSQMEAALCATTAERQLSECGIVVAMVRVPPAVLAILALSIRLRRPRPTLWWYAVGIAIVGLALTANPLTSARYWTGAVAFGLFGALWGTSATKRVALWLCVPALFLLVFPSTDFARREGWSLNDSFQPRSFLDKDFDAFDQLANSASYVDSFGHRGGRQLASALFFFVPRSIWADKAPPSGPLVAQALGVTNNLNLSASLWEEAYIDFGLLGVIAVLMGLGWCVWWLETRAALGHGAAGGALALAHPFLAGYAIYLLRGPLLATISMLGVVVAVLACCVALETQRLRRAQSGTRPALAGDKMRGL